MWEDVINSLFEAFGAIALCFSIIKVLKDKKVRGISWVQVAFFSTWGLWNIHYYSNLNQWFSFSAGIILCVANLIYTFLLIYYTVKEKNNAVLDRDWETID